MLRRKFVATGGLLICSGCSSDADQNAQTDSEFVIINERDSELEVSIRLKDGKSAFAVEGLVLDGGTTSRFTAGFVNVNGGDMSIVAKILNPQEATYEQKAIPMGVPQYRIRIHSDDINVIWAEK